MNDKIDVEIPKEIADSEYLTLFKNVLVDGNEYDNQQVKIYTIRRIATIAKVIGPEATRIELLPFISLHIDSLEDEILYSLSEELELFLPLIGGQEHATELFTILLKISRTVDETTVRNKTIEIIRNLLSKLDEEYVNKYVVSFLVKRDDDIWFSEKCSTLSLIPVCYSQANPENRIILRQKFCEVFDDTSTLIRKLASQRLPELIEVLEIEHVLKDVMPILTKIEENDQECVKMYIPEIALSVARKSNNAEVRNDLLHVIRRFSENDSWRIRQKTAEIIDEIAITFVNDELQSIIVEIYENLVNDSETEVRVAAVKNMYNFMKNLRGSRKEETVTFDEYFRKNCMPIILFVTSDENTNVQIAFSSIVLSLSQLISKECFVNTVLPIVVDGLESNKPLVYKENIFINLDYLPDNVDLIKSLSSIKTIMQNILINSDNSWRTRRSLLLTLVHVSKYCSEKFFNENLSIYYIFLLKDKIYAVRRTATIILPILAKRFGMKWLIIEIMPHIHVTLHHEKYLIRYIILFCIQELIQPSVDENSKQNKIFLNDLKELLNVDEKHFGRKLYKIIKLNENLIKSLKDKPFNSISNSYNDENNLKGENIGMYSEELFESMKKNKVEIFSIKNNLLDHEMCYLEGILLLLNENVLNILKMLIKDPISNIQDRAKYVTNEVVKFSDMLDKEIRSTQWILNHVRKIEEVTWTEIDTEINQDIQTVFSQVENVGKNDTDFMEILANERRLSRTSIDGIKNVEHIEMFPKDDIKLVVHVKLEDVHEEKKILNE